MYLKGKSKEDWLDIDPVLMTFSNNRRKAVDYYKDFMEEKMDIFISKFYSKKNQSSILGEKDFVDWIKGHYLSSDKKTTIEIKEKKRIQGEVMVQKINSEVSSFFGIQKESLFQSKRGEENIPRLMALLLSKELSGLFLSHLAKLYGINSYRTVGSICYRFNEKVKQNNKISKQFKKLKTLCSQ